MKKFKVNKKILKEIIISDKNEIEEDIFHGISYSPEHTKFVWFPYPHKKTFKEGFYNNNNNIFRKYYGNDITEIFRSYISKRSYKYEFSEALQKNRMERLGDIKFTSKSTDYYIDQKSKKIMRRKYIGIVYKDYETLLSRSVENYPFNTMEEALEIMNALEDEFIINKETSEVIDKSIKYLKNIKY